MRHPHWHSRNDSSAKQWATFRRDLRKEVRNGGEYEITKEFMGIWNPTILRIRFTDGLTHGYQISSARAKLIQSFQI